MSGGGKARRRKVARRPHYRDTVGRLKDYLRPVDPSPEFIRRLEALCESLGARELFASGSGERAHGARRGVIIGGAICSALPFLGVAAYAIGKLVQRRRVVPIGA
jgi:hypothetical protein